MHTKFPRLKAIEPLPNRKLRATFVDDTVKIYDCNHLLESRPFQLLKDEAFFRAVHVEPHGYAAVWNDEIDLAESELWLHGKSPDTDLQRSSRGVAAEA